MSETVINDSEVAQAQLQVHEERYNFDVGEVLRFTPDEVRMDEVSGEPVAPIVYMQGMNGIDKLPDIMSYIANKDKRAVIGVRYYNKSTISPKPIDASSGYYRSDAVIPTLDAHKADDILGALQVLGDVKTIDIVAESAGGVRALLVADNLSKAVEVLTDAEDAPIHVGNVLLVDPAGQDGRSYVETHLDALKLARAEKRAQKLGTIMLEPIAEAASINPIAKQLRDRPDQKAVAHAQMASVLGDVAKQVPVRVLSDKQDLAFQTERVATMMQATGADEYATLIKTDKGGHGVGLNKLALDTVIANLHQMEQSSANLDRPTTAIQYD